MKNFNLFAPVVVSLVALSQIQAGAATQVQGGMSGGGGDPLRFHFEEGRDLAVHILNEIENRSLSAGKDHQATEWLKASRQKLAEDLAVSPLIWKEGHNTCAWTGFAPESPIELSFENCRAQISSKEEAAKLLLHETAHHLLVEDHALADRIAMEIFAAWERLKLQSVPACPTEQNVVASVLPGSWKMNVELRKQLAPKDTALDDLKLTFVRDDLVADRFPPLGACALMAGRITFENLRDETLTADAVLLPHKGNVHLVWLEKMNEDGTPDLESSILNAARAEDTENDILFFGDDFNEPGVFPLQRTAE